MNYNNSMSNNISNQNLPSPLNTDTPTAIVSYLSDSQPAIESLQDRLKSLEAENKMHIRERVSLIRSIEQQYVLISRLSSRLKSKYDAEGDFTSRRLIERLEVLERHNSLLLRIIAAIGDSVESIPASYSGIRSQAYVAERIVGLLESSQGLDPLIDDTFDRMTNLADDLSLRAARELILPEEPQWTDNQKNISIGAAPSSSIPTNLINQLISSPLSAASTHPMQPMNVNQINFSDLGILEGVSHKQNNSPSLPKQIGSITAPKDQTNPAPLIPSLNNNSSTAADNTSNIKTPSQPILSINSALPLQQERSQASLSPYILSASIPNAQTGFLSSEKGLVFVENSNSTVTNQDKPTNSLSNVNTVHPIEDVVRNSVVDKQALPTSISSEPASSLPLKVVGFACKSMKAFAPLVSRVLRILLVESTVELSEFDKDDGGATYSVGITCGEWTAPDDKSMKGVELLPYPEIVPGIDDSTADCVALKSEVKFDPTFKNLLIDLRKVGQFTPGTVYNKDITFSNPTSNFRAILQVRKPHKSTWSLLGTTGSFQLKDLNNSPHGVAVAVLFKGLNKRIGRLLFSQSPSSLPAQSSNTIEQQQQQPSQQQPTPIISQISPSPTNNTMLAPKAANPASIVTTSSISPSPLSGDAANHKPFPASPARTPVPATPLLTKIPIKKFSPPVSILPPALETPPSPPSPASSRRLPVKKLGGPPPKGVPPLAKVPSTPPPPVSAAKFAPPVPTSNEQASNAATPPPSTFNKGPPPRRGAPTLATKKVLAPPSSVSPPVSHSPPAVSPSPSSLTPVVANDISKNESINTSSGHTLSNPPPSLVLFNKNSYEEEDESNSVQESLPNPSQMLSSPAIQIIEQPMSANLQPLTPTTPPQEQQQPPPPPTQQKSIPVTKSVRPRLSTVDASDSEVVSDVGNPPLRTSQSTPKHPSRAVPPPPPKATVPSANLRTAALAPASDSEDESQVPQGLYSNNPGTTPKFPPAMASKVANRLESTPARTSHPTSPPPDSNASLDSPSINRSSTAQARPSLPANLDSPALPRKSLAPPPGVTTPAKSSSQPPPGVNPKLTSASPPKAMPAFPKNSTAGPPPAANRPPPPPPPPANRAPPSSGPPSTAASLKAKPPPPPPKGAPKGLAVVRKV